MHNQPREPQLMSIVKQNRFKNLGELHKEWTEAGVKASRATTHRRVEEFGFSCRQRCLTWAKEKKNWTVASGPKSSFQMRSSFVFHLETKVLESGWRVEKLIAQVAWSPVLSFHSLWWFGVHLLVLVHCVFWKPTSLHHLPKNADELKATVKETWASMPPQQCHKLITSMPRRFKAVIKAKGAHTKYWVQLNTVNEYVSWIQ